MFELVKDAINMGVGAAAMSRENLERIAANLTEMGKLSREEGERIVKEFENSRVRYHEELLAKIDAKVREVIDKMGLTSKEQAAELERRIALLEAQLKASGGASGDTTDADEPGQY